MSAATGLAIAEAVADRLNEKTWPFGEGSLRKPPDFPAAKAFLSRGAEGQRNRLLVYLVSEVPGESRGGRGPTVQRVTAELALLLLLPRRNDRGGQRARETAREWLQAVRTRMLAKGGPGADRFHGWQPPEASRPLAWLRGDLEPFDGDDNYWIWVDRYRAEWTLDSQRFNSD